jgi:hypothetical protein
MFDFCMFTWVLTGWMSGHSEGVSRLISVSTECNKWHRNFCISKMYGQIKFKIMLLALQLMYLEDIFRENTNKYWLLVNVCTYLLGTRGGVVVKALRYYPAGREFDSRWSQIGIFQWHNSSGRTMTLGSTQPLTEMSTRCISWGVKATGA